MRQSFVCARFPVPITDLDHHANELNAESFKNELASMSAFDYCCVCTGLGLAAESSSSNNSTWFRSPTALFVVSNLLSNRLLVC
jgi:hypothetical protein